LGRQLDRVDAGVPTLTTAPEEICWNDRRSLTPTGVRDAIRKVGNPDAQVGDAEV
jgi:hypothetical protein